MKNRRFYGWLGNYIMQHLKLRRSLGVLSQADESTLKKFNHYQRRNFPKAQTITREMVVGYLKTNTHLHSSSRANEVIYLRQFCLYLSRLDLAVYLPERSLVPKARPKVRVHIFDVDEIHSLIRAAKALKPNHTLVPHTYATLIALLWVTGLRMGEALRLNLEDIDWSEGLLHVRKTKFFKSRLVPLAESALGALKAYLFVRRQFKYEDHPQAPLFMSLQRKRLSKRTLNTVFRRLTQRAGIKTALGNGPRLHDLRHSFATHTLNDHYKEGKDPNAYLPILATYMGHTDPKHTQVYLHPSIQTLQAASQRFAKQVRTRKCADRRR